ncbi:AAA family ATPase [Aeromonas dhakensis]|uniref:AAA family ATPase n=1 Tax=Aeromonas dhakensis TaxID=196024 RepID=UPI00029B4684|nr:AAA family ATPase [Aeromonas dhakensis]BEJ48626.1 AAA family ATPase [Aeromonas dhakensis]HDZ8910169.1 ATP-binding protein [Aeromonas dhakensis]
MAKNVHDQFNFSIKFNDDLNFITGINGSGKTTALKLMKAAITFDLNTLISISFSMLSMEIDHANQIYSIEIHKRKGIIKLNLNNNIIDIEDSLIDDNSGLIYENHRDYIDSIFYKKIINGDEIYRSFLKDIKPLFLGLERQTDYSDDEDLIFKGQFISRRIRNGRGNNIDGLENCKKIIEDAYRKYRRVSDGSLNRIVNVIIGSSFEYIDVDHAEIFNLHFSPRVELQKLKERQEDLQTFTSKIGLSNQASKQINKFFTQMSDALNNYTSERGENVGIEWLINLAQIKRIKDVISEIDRQKKATEVYLSPIEDYTSTINKFLRHSKKTLQVDKVGQVIICGHNGKAIDINNLSSGEKQILILLTHARLGNNKNRVFIVDEPELSLHLKWQEMLVDELIKDAKNVQFICATHSPEIVGYHTKKCIKVS